MITPPAVRDDGVTTGPPATCPTCQTTFLRNGRRRFCSHACRQAAYRARQQPASATPSPPRRTTTVYQCPQCEQRYLAEQRCPDCNVFCRRLGPGGDCPHCGETVAAQDLLP
jgi:hypothetical protein